MENQCDIAGACRDWWLVDGEFDALTAQYSSAEIELIRKFGALEAATSDAGSAEMLRSIEDQFESLDQRRESCRQALESLPVRTIEDAANKLAIAARLLNDEGGFEARTVEEVARFLASCGRVP